MWSKSNSGRRSDDVSAHAAAQRRNASAGINGGTIIEFYVLFARGI